MNRTKKKRGGSARGPPAAATLDETVYDIVIIAGQSNAVGCGIRNVCEVATFAGCEGKVDLRKNSTVQGAIRLAGYELIDTNKVKMFSSDHDSADYVHPNKNKIVDIREPLDHTVARNPAEDSNKISFATSFAREYITKTSMGSRKLLIVGCAITATGIREWIINGELYNVTIDRLRKVRSCLSVSNNSKVVAFLWHQGESDMTSIFSSANVGTTKTSYKSILRTSLTGMRTAIMPIFDNSNGGYTFPILLGGLSYDKQWNRITGVKMDGLNARGQRTEYRQEMSELISELSDPNDIYFIPKSAFVSSDYFTFLPRLEGNSVMDASGDETYTYGSDGNHHFSATSMRELGRRYFFFFTTIKNQ